MRFPLLSAGLRRLQCPARDQQDAVCSASADASERASRKPKHHVGRPHAQRGQFACPSRLGLATTRSPGRVAESACTSCPLQGRARRLPPWAAGPRGLCCGCCDPLPPARKRRRRCAAHIGRFRSRGTFVWPTQSASIAASQSNWPSKCSVCFSSRYGVASRLFRLCDVVLEPCRCVYHQGGGGGCNAVVGVRLSAAVRQDNLCWGWRASRHGANTSHATAGVVGCRL